MEGTSACDSAATLAAPREDESPSKRFKMDENSRSCTHYSMEPDLQVIVEGKTMSTYSQVLMNISPVFQQMLLTNMAEGTAGRIELAGKSSDEFDTFLKVLVWKAEVSPANCMFLSVWADEYQVDGLKVRCEDVIMKFIGVSCAALDHAITYNLHRRAEQCFALITRNLREHIHELTSLKSVSTETLRKLWPSICRTAKVEATMPDDLHTGHALWPFVVKAIVSIPLQTVKAWPDEIYRSLPARADTAAKAWLDRKVLELEAWPH